MKILHVLGTARPVGGAEAYALVTAAAQERAGHEVAFLHTDAQPSLNGTAQHRATDVASALAWTKALEPDVVHVHGSPLEAELERGLQKRYAVVRSLHDYSFACASTHHYFRDGAPCTRAHGPGCIAGLALRGCAHRADVRPVVSAYRRVGERLPLVRDADAVVVYSDYVRQTALRNGVPADRCRTIPYFVQRAAQPPAPFASRTVAFAGRISSAKGLDVLLRALGRTPGWDSLLVIGDGWQRAECERLARELHIDDRIEWLGWLGAGGVRTALARARVVAVPSRWPEPFGIVGIEAMAQARAVVASRAGGIPEWLDDRETGLLVEPGDVDALALALERVLVDEPLAIELGLRGWQRAERFAPDRHLAALDAVYAEVA